MSPAAAPIPGAVTKERKRSYWHDVFKRFSRHKLAMAGLAVIALELVARAGAPPGPLLHEH